MTFGFGMGFPRDTSAAGGPSLNLQFAGSTTLDPSITFTRASSGSYYNSSGYLQLAPVNLLLYSSEFDNAAWFKGLSSVTANTTIAPNGTLTADTLSFSAAANANLQPTTAPTVTIGQQYTYSVYVRASSAVSNVNIAMIGSDVAIAVTTEWQRVSRTVTASGSTLGPTLVTRNAVATDIYIWGAQLETGTTASTYIPTTGTVNGAPRLDYNPSTLQPQGLLIEEARTNLLTYSSNFDAAGWSVARATIAVDTTTDPSKAVTADSLVEDTTNNSHPVFKSVVGLSAVAYTQSCYIKVAGRTQARILFGNTSFPAGPYVDFDLVAVTAAGANGGSGTITAVGNGWFRCTATATAVVGDGTVYIQPAVAGSITYLGTGITALYLWGAQLEAGAFPTSYIPSTNTFTSRASTGTYYGSNGLIQTAAINVARFNYNPANLTIAPTLLLEAAATNLLTYSSQFDNAAWTKNSVTTVADVAVSPDGTVSAEKIIPLTTNNAHSIYGSYVYSAGAYTLSIYAKAAGYNWIRVGSMFTGSSVYFDLLTGVVGAANSGYTGSIQSVGNGWYRCSVTWTATAGTDLPGFYVAQSGSVISYAGDGTSGIYVWGAQLEAGSGATSYIPTVASQVTRDADLSTSAAATRAQDFASITTLTPWYNATEGTLMAVAIPSSPVTSTIKILAAFDDGTFAQRAQIVKTSGTSFVNGVVTVGTAVYTGSVTTPWAIDTIGKAALAYKSSDNKIAFNGVLDTVATSTAGVPTVTKLAIGARYDGGTPWNGAISSITYYPRRLSDTELQSITA